MYISKTASHYYGYIETLRASDYYDDACFTPSLGVPEVRHPQNRQAFSLSPCHINCHESWPRDSRPFRRSSLKFFCSPSKADDQHKEALLDPGPKRVSAEAFSIFVW